jgi:hypothetical protein
MDAREGKQGDPGRESGTVTCDGPIAERWTNAPFGIRVCPADLVRPAFAGPSQL